MAIREVTLGIDIGGTNTKMGLVDRYGVCLCEKSFPTDSEHPFEDFINRVERTLGLLKDQAGEPVSVLGIGIGAPNANYYSGLIEQAPNLRWGDRVPIVEMTSSRLKLPVYLTNDANAAALGEMKYGVAKGMKNFVVITLGTGLGSGIVVNGELVLGHDGFAGEIGHTTVFMEGGREVPTGRTGSLEAYVSAPGIKRTVFELLAKRLAPSPLRSMSFEEMDAHHITEAALAGDAIAREAFEYTGQLLGLKLSDTIAHLSPEAIILFGGLANAGDVLFEPTKRYMEIYNLNIFKNKVKLLLSNLKGNNVAILGASALAWTELERR
jgi:glucokinase